VGDEDRKVDGAWGLKPESWMGRGSEEPGSWIGRGVQKPRITIGRRGGIAWLSCLPDLTLIFFKYKDN